MTQPRMPVAAFSRVVRGRRRRGTDHDQHETRRGERSEHRRGVRQPRHDDADRAEQLAGRDEPEQRQREHGRPRLPHLEELLPRPGHLQRPRIREDHRRAGDGAKSPERTNGSREIPPTHQSPTGHQFRVSGSDAGTRAHANGVRPQAPSSPIVGTPRNAARSRSGWPSTTSDTHTVPRRGRRRFSVCPESQPGHREDCDRNRSGSSDRVIRGRKGRAFVENDARASAAKPGEGVGGG